MNHYIGIYLAALKLTLPPLLTLSGGAPCAAGFDRARNVPRLGATN